MTLEQRWGTAQLGAWLASALLVGGLAPSAAGAFEAGAVLELESATGLRGPRQQKLEAIFEPTLEGRVGAFDWLASGRLRADAWDRIEPGHPTPTETSSITRRGFAGDAIDFELRELYLRGELGPAFLTVGKQQVVWGQADGLKVLDVVNPQDFREFILDDFDDSRIPLWTVNAEIPLPFGGGHHELQLLWIPDPSFHEIPDADATFAFSAPRLVPPAPPGLSVVTAAPNRPRSFLADGDAGFRFSSRAGPVDWTLNYLYHHDDRPIPFTRLEAGAEGPRLRVSPAYRRTHLVGATATGVVGDFTLRGEIGWSSDRYLPTTDPRDEDGIVRRGELQSVFGIDWFGLDQTLVSLQLFYGTVLGSADDLLRDRADPNLTLLARRSFWNERVQLEAIWIHGLHEQDGLVRPKLLVEVRDGVELWGGARSLLWSGRGAVRPVRCTRPRRRGPALGVLRIVSRWIWIALLLAPLVAGAETLDGDAVAAKINARDEGETVSRRVVMELEAKNGSVRSRETRIFRRFFGDEKRMAVFFRSPRTIRDTAFLAYDHPGVERDDELWMYLPALRKSRRIAIGDRGKAFFGTDLSYEDVKLETRVSIEDYSRTIVGEETIDDVPCLVLEQIPVDDATARSLGYGKVRAWVDREIWIVRRAEYWDHRGKKLKSSRLSEIREVDGIWTVHRIDVENHQNGHRTRFLIDEVRYGVPLEETLFTESALRRGPPKP